MKPVESSGGNGSQSWLSNKDFKLQQFWGETFRSKLQLPLWGTWGNYYCVRIKREICWAGILQSFSLSASSFFFSRKNQKNYKEEWKDTDNILLTVRGEGWDMISLQCLAVSTEVPGPQGHTELGVIRARSLTAWGTGGTAKLDSARSRMACS